MDIKTASAQWDAANKNLTVALQVCNREALHLRPAPDADVSPVRFVFRAIVLSGQVLGEEVRKPVSLRPTFELTTSEHRREKQPPDSCGAIGGDASLVLLLAVGVGERAVVLAPHASGRTRRAGPACASLCNA